MIYSIEGKSPVIDEKAGFIASEAAVIGEAFLAEGVSVWFNAVIRADIASIRIGKNSNVQDCAVIHVDRGVPTVVGEGVTIGHGAVVHGCTVGDNCLIGMNAVVLSGAEIGNDCLIAAGSLVPQGMKIPDRSLVVGSPARVVKELKPGMVDAIRRNGSSYVSVSSDYLEELAAL